MLGERSSYLQAGSDCCLSCEFPFWAAGRLVAELFCVSHGRPRALVVAVRKVIAFISPCCTPFLALGQCRASGCCAAAMAVLALRESLLAKHEVQLPDGRSCRGERLPCRGEERFWRAGGEDAQQMSA